MRATWTACRPISISRKRGEMSIRGQVMNVLEYIQELDGRIDAIEAMRYENDYMHFAGAKFQVDGALEGFVHQRAPQWHCLEYLYLEAQGLERSCARLP